MTRNRNRRRLTAALAAAALVLVALTVWGMYGRFTLNAEERNLVGLWSQTREGVPTHGLLVEFEVRPDRTVLLVNRDETTRAVTLRQEEYDDWRLRDGVLRLCVRQPRPVGPWYALRKHQPPPRYDELRVEADGPDRVRYTLVRSEQQTPAAGEPLPAGVWTRVDGK